MIPSELFTYVLSRSFNTNTQLMKDPEWPGLPSSPHLQSQSCQKDSSWVATGNLEIPFLPQRPHLLPTALCLISMRRTLQCEWTQILYPSSPFPAQRVGTSLSWCFSPLRITVTLRGFWKENKLILCSASLAFKEIQARRLRYWGWVAGAVFCFLPTRLVRRLKKKKIAFFNLFGCARS